MPLQNFVAKTGPAISAAWLNSVDVLKFTIFGDATTPVQARANLTSDAPLEVANGGTGTRGSGASFLTFLASFFPSLYQYINPITPEEAAALVTPTDYSYTAASGDIRRYGAILDGLGVATDNVPALIKACAVGGNIVINGSMALASASLAALTNNAVALRSSTKIRGIPGLPIIITGNTPCNVFYSTDVSNIKFEDVFAIGNGVGTLTTGYFWYIKCTAAAVRDSVNLKFIHGGLENFAGHYWCYADNTAAVTYACRGILFDGLRITSKTGNAQGPTDITSTASIFGFSGSDTVTSFYSVTDCVVRNCYADGTFVKSFAYFWSGVRRCRADKNNLVNFGADASFTNDTGAYALAAYDHAHGAALSPDEIHFDGNIVDGVRDAGVYVAGANRISLKHNKIRGQTSTADGTLPKGGIAINQAVYATLLGNEIGDSARSVELVVAAGNSVNMQDTTITGMAVAGTAVRVAPTGVGTVGEVIIDGLYIDTALATTVCMRLDSTSTVGLANFALRNFKFNCPYAAFNLFSADSSVPALGTVRIANGEIQNITNNGLQLQGASNAATRITLEDIVFTDPGAAAVVFDVIGSTGLTIRNITFQDMVAGGAGRCWYGATAQGTVEGVRYRNVAITNRYSGSANELGVVAPVWTGNDNDFVQDLNPTELTQVIAAANVKYTRQGWVWDRVAAAWKECRALTGN